MKGGRLTKDLSVVVESFRSDAQQLQGGGSSKEGWKGGRWHSPNVRMVVVKIPPTLTLINVDQITLMAKELILIIILTLTL